MTENMTELEKATASAIMSARVLTKAQEDYDKIMRNYGAMVEIHKPLNIETFWRITGTYRSLILQAIMTTRAEPAKWAADEMFRLSAYNNAASWWERKMSMYMPSFYETLNYAFMYHDFRRQTYKVFDAIKHVSEHCGKSDDSFGDLIDGLPLLGERFFKRMEAKKFYDYPHFKKVARKTVMDIVADLGDDYTHVADKMKKRFSHMILEGENYFGMMLEDAAKEWFPRYYKDKEVNEEVEV